MGCVAGARGHRGTSGTPGKKRATSACAGPTFFASSGGATALGRSRLASVTLIRGSSITGTSYLGCVTSYLSCVTSERLRRRGEANRSNLRNLKPARIVSWKTTVQSMQILFVRSELFADQLFAFAPQCLCMLRIEGVRPNALSDGRIVDVFCNVAVFAVLTADLCR